MTGASRLARRGAWGLVAALVLAVSACGGSSSTKVVGPVRFEFSGDAATVDGEVIPAKVIADELAAYQAAPAAVKPAFNVDDIRQLGSDQPEPAVVAKILATEIFIRVIAKELQVRGVAVPATVRNLAETQMQAQFGDALNGSPALRAELIDRYATYVTLDQLLSPPPPDDAAIQAAYDRDPAQWAEQACARHILVATEQQANDVLAQLRGGADFGQVAKATSADPGSGANGGDLGCVPRGQYVADFEKAVWEGPVGELQGPVKTQFGFHIIRVDKRGPLSVADARPQIIQQLSPPAFQPLGEWLKTKMPTVKVTVDPRYGVWDAAGGDVIPVGVQTSGLKVGADDPSTTSAPPSSR